MHDREHGPNNPTDGRSLVPSADRDVATSSRAIVVNGRSVPYVGYEISHGDLVRLAYPGVQTDAGRSFTVLYGNGPSRTDGGMVTANKRVAIEDGQTFHVTLTDKS